MKTTPSVRSCVFLRRCVCFCASVPYFSSAGPSIQIPKDIRGGRADIAFISSRRILPSAFDSPPPPQSTGHSGAVQRFSTIRSSQTFCSSFLNVGCRPPQTESSSSRSGWRIADGQLLSSHARVSRRNVFRSAIIVSECIRPAVQQSIRILLQSLPPMQVSDVASEVSHPPQLTGFNLFRQGVGDGADRRPCSECPVTHSNCWHVQDQARPAADTSP